MATWADLTDSFNNEQQIDEMRKKYENCYVFMKPEGKKPVLVQYKGFAEDYHLFRDLHEVSVRVKHNTNTEILSVHPDKGLFNADRRMFYFARRPNRQYRRGVCKDNSLIYDPVYCLWQERDFFMGSYLQYAFECEYPNIQKAVDLLRNNEAVSVAFSRDFGVSQSFTKDSNSIFLWYHDSCIGLVDAKSVVHICNEYFEQEVLDNIKQFEPLKVKFNASK